MHYVACMKIIAERKLKLMLLYACDKNLLLAQYATGVLLSAGCQFLSAIDGKF